MGEAKRRQAAGYVPPRRGQFATVRRQQRKPGTLPLWFWLSIFIVVVALAVWLSPAHAAWGEAPTWAAITVTLGWWVLPLAVTGIAFLWHVWMHAGATNTSGYSGIGDAFGQLLTLSAATVVSLLAWLGWAVLR